MKSKYEPSTNYKWTWISNARQYGTPVYVILTHNPTQIEQVNNAVHCPVYIPLEEHRKKKRNKNKKAIISTPLLFPVEEEKSLSDICHSSILLWLSSRPVPFFFHSFPTVQSMHKLMAVAISQPRDIFRLPIWRAENRDRYNRTLPP